MSASGFIIGIVALFFCLFLAGTAGTFFTGLTTDSINLLKMSFLSLGIISMFVGILDE